MAGTITGTIITSTYTLTTNPTTITSTGAIDVSDPTKLALYGPTGTAWTVVNAGTVEHLGSAPGTNGIAIRLQSGGLLQNSGLVFAAEGNAVSIRGSAGTVSNTGTIKNTATFAQVGTLKTGRYGALVLNAGGSVTNGATDATTALIAGHTGITVNNVAGTIANFGTIAQNDPVKYGTSVLLYGGGSVTNGAVGSTAALITAYADAINIGPSSSGNGTGGIGLVTNFGTIRSTGTGRAIYLGNGGSITNNGLISSQNSNAISLKTVAATVVNSGLIQSNATASGSAIYTGSGGIITNSNTGTITATRNDIVISNVAATVVNNGLIQNSGTNAAIYSRAGGYITNNTNALIQSTRTGISFNDTAGTTVSFGSVVNSGSIISTGVTAGAGVYFAQGGVLANQIGGLISAYRIGFSAVNTPANVSNFATILGTGAGTIGTGIFLGAGGQVSNGSNIIGTARITGSFRGINMAGAGTVDNFGTISSNSTSGGQAILMTGGGTITNEQGALVDGTGGNAVSAGGGTSGQALTVTNKGTMQSLNSPGATVYFGHGGVLTNQAGALIKASNRNAVSFNNTLVAGASIGSVINSGTITSLGSTAGSGIYFGQGGLLTNGTLGLSTALISASHSGVTLAGTAGTIDNFGTIASSAAITGAGVELAAGGTVINETGGLISAVKGAISIDGSALSGTTTNTAALVVNHGTISGRIGIGIGRLDLAQNTIDNFGTITSTFGPSGTAINLGTVGGQVVVIETQSSLVGVVANVQVGDVFDLPFRPFDASGTATLGPNNQLQIVENGGTFTINLDPAQNLAGDAFVLGTDTVGGTKVTVNLHNGGSNTDRDFNGDGKQDVLLRSSTSGSFVDWTMNGPAITSADSVTFGGTPIALDQSWSLAGTADFNGDLKADILLRNPTTSGFVDFTMNGPTITAADNITFNGTTVGLDNSWSVLGTGDFNGDGKADILLHNTNGSFTDFTMNGSAITAADSLTFGGTPISLDSSWSVVGTDDFNGDGKADILLRNPNTSGFVVFTMNGATITAADNVTFGGNPVGLDSSWTVLGTGDFNGDGKADVLLHNTDGAFTDFTMNGSAITAADNLTFQGSVVKLDSSWTFDDIGDFNGDGKADILYRNTNGSFTDFTMNGSTITAAQNLTFQGNVVLLDNSWQT